MGIDARLIAVVFPVALMACAGTESAQQIAAEATKASVACPSQDFGKFLRAFSESADVQRQFTSLPLERGLRHVDALDTPKEYTGWMIGTFEEIPTLDRQDGQRIFPSKNRRTRGHLLIKEETGKPEVPQYPGERRSPDDRVVRLYIEDTGFYVYYRFAGRRAAYRGARYIARRDGRRHQQS
jgi:hypothetical protein